MIEDFFKIIKDIKADKYLAWNDKVQRLITVAETLYDKVSRQQRDFVKTKFKDVEVLLEENARLREALKPFAYIAEHVGEEDARWAVPSAHLRAAAAAIREGGKDG
jgi:hypothetical protein